MKHWIMVDLATSYKILFITIVNSRRAQYINRLKSLTIRFGNSKDKESNLFG